MNFTLSEHSIVDICLFIAAYLITIMIVLVKTVFDHRTLRKEVEDHKKDSEKETLTLSTLVATTVETANKKSDELLKVMHEIDKNLVLHLERISVVETEVKNLKR